MAYKWRIIVTNLQGKPLRSYVHNSYNEAAMALSKLPLATKDKAIGVAFITNDPVKSASPPVYLSQLPPEIEHVLF